MPSMTDAMSGLAHAIAQHRQDRAEAATLRRKAANARSIAVTSQLHDARRSRGAAAREYRAAASTANAQRSKEVATDLANHLRRRQARHRRRLGLAAAQRRQLVTFMAGLTADVTALRDGFRADRENQRSAQHHQLSAFMSDLATGVAAWRAGFRADLKGRRLALEAAAHGVHQQLDEARRDRLRAGDAWQGRKPAPPARPAVNRPPRPEPARPGAAPSAAPQPAASGIEPVSKLAAPQPGPAAMGAAPGQAPPHQRPYTAPQSQPAVPTRGHGGSPASTEGRKPS